MVTLTSNEIFRIGKMLETELIQHKAKYNNQLVIDVDEDSFKKIDEDLYYRQHHENEEFIPSFDSITISFSLLTITIRKIKTNN